MTRCLAAVAIFLSLTPGWLTGAQFTLEKNDDGVTVKCDGQFMTRYLQKSGAKPVLWPIVGPSGKEMTRGYPLREATGDEKKDHIHQRSFWFDHGDVNGVSFWDEQGAHGTIEHREYLQLAEGEVAVIRTANDWKNPDGSVVCRDVRTMKFGASRDVRWIDFEVRVTAAADKVVFGDTKEGSFGLRVAGSMRVELNKGGRIINSQGQTNDEAWGKRAAWVDYSGPVDGETVGIAILNHPRSLRYPTFWHVRTYGLFAANPFGWHDFLGSDTADGALTLAAGESFDLYYRVVLHRGDEKQGGIAEAFQRYADEPVGQ